MLLVPYLRGTARHLQLMLLALVAATAAAFAQTNTADGFDPNVDGAVLGAAVQQADSKVILVGQFAHVAPNGSASVTRNNIARFNADGSLDTAFDPNANGPVRAVGFYHGQIIIVGDFTTVGGKTHNGIARLNADGTVDDTYTASIGKSLDAKIALPVTPQVYALAVEPDGSVIAGGAFGSASSTGVNPVQRNNLVRFKPDGSLDPNYNPNPNAQVLALAMHTGLHVIVGGGFTKFLPNGATTAVTRNRIARLNDDGTVDPNFDPNADDGVTSIAVQRDGMVLFAGYFTHVQPAGQTTLWSRNRIARVDATGALDLTFSPSVNAPIMAVGVAPDGGIVIGGRFSQTYDPSSPLNAHGYIARLTRDGLFDDAFAAGFNFEVDALAFQPDGKIVVGGLFTRVTSAGLTADLVRNHAARLLPNGAIDAAFDLETPGRVLATVSQADKLVVGGTFTNIGNTPRQFLARLNADGTVDSAFNPVLDGAVYAMVQDGTGRIIVGGAFTHVGPTGSQTVRNHIARFDANGTLDTTFDPNLNGAVGSLLIQSDGSIIVGGVFTTAQPIGVTAAVPRSHILRLTAGGQLDDTFDPNTDSAISGMALQSDGKIVIVGAFTALQPHEKGDVAHRSYIARLNSDGTVDANYNPNASAPGVSVTLQSDGSAIITGRFTQLFPRGASAVINRNSIVRVKTDGSVDATFDPNPNAVVMTTAVQGDGKILVGGAFTSFTPNAGTTTVTMPYVARLNADGTVDSTFELKLNQQIGNRVDLLQVLANGDILVGGTFTSLQPTGATAPVRRLHFARVTSAGALVTSFDPGASGPGAATVDAIAVQPDNKILAGGSFTDLGGATSTNIARYFPEGTPDQSFNGSLTVDGTVQSIAVRAMGLVTPTPVAGFSWLESNGAPHAFSPSLRLRGTVNASVRLDDGSVILGGAFADLSGTHHNNLVKIHADGTVDSVFTPYTAPGIVTGMLLESQTSLLIWGNFTSVDDIPVSYLARIDTTSGAVTANFKPNPNGAISSVAIQSNGMLVIGGTFTSLTPASSGTAVTRNYAARIDKDTGVPDASFNPNFDGAVYSIVIQGDGKIVFGGAFANTTPGTTTTAVPRNHIARFNADGTLDTSFDPNASNTVATIALQSDNALVLGGYFSTVGNVTHQALARVKTDGSLDSTFTPATNGAVTGLALASDGSILINGPFTTVTGTGSTTAIARNHFARLSNTGALDATFNPDFSGAVNKVVVNPDGTLLVSGSFTSTNTTGAILIGGTFAHAGGIALSNVAELNSDGSVFAGFQPNPNGTVNALLPLLDGRFLVGGAFTSIAGANRSGLARFAADGTLDANFNPTIAGTVKAVAPQGDGYLVGTTTTLVRVNADGSPDGSFNASATVAPVAAIAVQPDGKVLVARASGSSGPAVIRLNTDGTNDASFAAPTFAAGDTLATLTVQADGGVLVGGTFALTANGTTFNDVVRLTSTGAIDTSLNPNPNAGVAALALQADGRVLLGGSFSRIGDIQHVGIARVSNTAVATQQIDLSADGKTITWIRRGTVGDVTAVTFETSTDGITWTVAGTGKRIPGTTDWQLTNLSLPTNANVYIRARGIVPTSAGQSAGVYETSQVFNLGVQLSTASVTLAPVASSNAWDGSHYVWTVDGSGILRIADAYSQVGVDAGSTVLIDGSSLGTTSPAAARLANLSTRGTVTASTPLISGFAISGTASRQVLIRAAGPALAPFKVPNYLEKPELRLYDQAGTLLSTNTGWDSALTPDFVRVGAFPFTPGSTDAAFLVTLQPGTYTVQVADAGNGAGGDTLIEIYDASDLSDTRARLLNLSTRGHVAPGATLIGGLVLGGTSPKTVLIRGVGPTLAVHNVNEALSNPTIAVYDVNGNVVATNDDWSVSTIGSIPEASYASAVAAAALQVSAFPLLPGSKDAALVISLPAGTYTVQLRGVNNATGTGLIEVYELP